MGAKYHYGAGSLRIAETVIDYAIKNNITKIVVGKPQRRRWLKAPEMKWCWIELSARAKILMFMWSAAAANLDKNRK
jgi:K+-sensing histidine kinase KdpD